MDELKYLTNKHNYVLISSAMDKICKSIRKQQPITAERNIKEIDFLREHCTSSNTQIALLACQTFVRLVQDSTLELSRVLTMFITMFSATDTTNQTALSESVISLLLLDLKRRTILQANKQIEYRCQFGLTQPQHPLISLLINQKDTNLNDFANKINGICNHHDSEIRSNSIEFLRPVFLYILCNPNIIQNSKTIWTYLLAHSKSSKEAEELIFEILLWNKTSSAALCLFSSILLTEAIEFMTTKTNYRMANELLLYQTVLVNKLINFGYDPRPTFGLILKTIHQNPNECIGFYNLFLFSLAKTLHIISPIYLPDIVRVLKVIIIQNNSGNTITRNMILDGLILWVANPSFLTTDAFADIQLLINFICSNKILVDQQYTLPILRPEIKYLHSNVAFTYDLSLLSEKFAIELDGNVKCKQIRTFIDSIKKNQQNIFCSKINLFLRGLLLSRNLCEDISLDILKILMNVVTINEHVAVDLLWILLYKLSKTSNANIQLEILKSIPTFCRVKENIPIILNVLKALTDGTMKCNAIDLYLRLWKCENRTYPFLYKALNNNSKDSDQWEWHVVKATAIKEICHLKPTQHGTDLVNLLSNILNGCLGNKGDLATSIALDAILILCKSHTVNIVSTWNALADKFNTEKRIRSGKSLCNFFGQVPLLRSPTMPYENFYVEAMQRLWRYTVYSDKQEIIEAALNALKTYNHNEMALRHLPDIFRQKVTLPSEYAKTPIDALKDPAEVLPYIPGECWIELIKNINHNAIGAASDLVAHYINEDIKSYRSGVYMVPDGKPEPNNLAQLSGKSPLKALIKFLIIQSKSSDMVDIVVTNILKCIATKFSKPIPPLNWFFLVEYFSRSYEMKKNALKILANQIFQSGSAKTLLENYLREFDPSKSTTIEIIDLLELTASVASGISNNIFIPFLENVFDYSYKSSLETNFGNDCLFRGTLNFFKMAANQNLQTCLNVASYTDIIKKYMEIIHINSNIFSDFAECCCFLQTSEIDSITSPNTWWEITPEKFMKSTIIRCKLIRINPSIENPFLWLNPLINNFTKSEVGSTFLLQNIAEILNEYKNERNICVWIMEYLSNLQILLSDNFGQNENHCLFLLDLLIMSIVVVTGCASLSGDLFSIAESRQKRINLFPEALIILCKLSQWQEFTSRIFNFIYHIYHHTELPLCFSDVARLSLICLKNQSFFIQNNNWIKFVGLKK